MDAWHAKSMVRHDSGGARIRDIFKCGGATLDQTVVVRAIRTCPATRKWRAHNGPILTPPSYISP